MDNRNLIIAIVLSAVIMFGWEYFFEKPRLEHQQALQQAAQLAAPAGQGAAPAGPAGAVSAQAAAAQPLSRDEALAKSPRIKIQSPRIHGSIALEGGRVDDVELNDYRATTDPDSPDINLLTPALAADAYFAEFGWLPGTGESVAVPSATTVWKSDRDTLTPEQPVTLSWDNGQGLTFTRTYALDTNYMFAVTQRVENHGSNPVTLFPYALVSRTGTPKVLGFSILHEGPIGVLNGTLREVKYKDIKDKRLINDETTGGWIGITDKYWLAAVIPDSAATVTARFTYTDTDGVDRYQVDFRGAPQAVAPGARAENSSRLFAGAKEVKLLDHYTDTLHIDRFYLAVDFGYLWFLTKPIFYALDFFHGWLGNFGLAIFLLTVLIKLVFFPLANKSYRAMAKMRALQPEMLSLRERFKDDKVRLNQEMMELYKREKVNPAAGCLPILIQIPVFFALYKVLFVTIEMRQAPFYGWIKDLSAPDPLSVLNLFGAIHWTPPQFLAPVSIGVWPILMGLTMYLQQKMNPQPPDPTQARIFAILPVVFTFLLAHMPAGLVIYWAWNNILSVAQQWVIMRGAGVKRP